jgi:DNA primase
VCVRAIARRIGSSSPHGFAPLPVRSNFGDRPVAALALDDADFRSFIERVKLAAPIEEVVGRRVSSLKRAGSTFKACCPFHEENTPSFVVTPARGTWRCFGACGEGGDAITFVQRDSGLSFREAVEELARSFGVELPRGWGSREGEDPRKAAAYEVLERAERFYARKLMGAEGATARDYLVERGLAPETLEAFGVGFAPTGNQLLASARAGGASLEALVDAGLVREGDRGPYDFFRGRITIPIHDALGRTVGFGARLLPGVEGPKYVNTTETALFHKGRLVYGLHLAREAVRRTRQVVLVEGYTDVMAAHQVGLRQVVAVLGTATTPEHATLVRRSGAQRATLLFDGDEAGRRAALKALRGLLAVEGLTVDVAVLPEGLDPADAFLGPERPELEGRIEQATPWFTYLLGGLIGVDTEALVEGVGECLELLTVLPDPIEREARVAELAATLGLSDESVRERWDSVRARSAPARPGTARRTAAGAPGSAPRVWADARGGEGADPARRAGGGNNGRTGGVEGAWIEARAWGEVAGALLADNGLIPVHRARVEAAAQSIEGADARIARILSALFELYDADEDGELLLDASAILTALADDPDRGLAVRLEDHARMADSPRALVEGALATLDRVEAERRREFARREALEAGDVGLLEAAERLRRERLTGASPDRTREHAGGLS